MLEQAKLEVQEVEEIDAQSGGDIARLDTLSTVSDVDSAIDNEEPVRSQSRLLS